jgi:hypothetical protein
MATVIDGTTGVTFPAGGLGNPAGAVVGTTDTQTLTNKSIATTQLTGRVPAASAPLGSVLQVVQTVKSDAFSSATKGSYVAVTGLAVAITPTSATNKILITANVTSGNLNNLTCMFHIYRDGAKITPDGVSTGLTPSDAYVLFAGGIAVNTGVSMTLPFQFLDSPNTTSSTTYQIYAAVNSSASLNLNVNPSSSSGGGSAGGNSSITVMEIAA